MKHHAIAIPTLTPADRILEAARKLGSAIKQQPKWVPMDKITGIDMLRAVLLGEQRSTLQQNSVQRAKTLQKAALQHTPSPAAESVQVTQAPIAM